MAAPNLKSPVTITGKTVGYAVTDTLTAALTNSSASGKVFKINSIYCANVDGAVSADVTLAYNDGTTDFNIAFEVAVPAKATQLLSSRETYFYLEEGDSLKAAASANGDLQLIIGYEEIS
jgi:hypothetical protein